MYKTLPLFLVALTALLAGCALIEEKSSHTVAKPAHLEMKLSFIDLEEAKFGDQKQIQINVEIRNVGESIVRIPKNIGGGIWVMSNYPFVSFDSGVFMTTRDGFRLPPATSELAIVELHPKEAVILHSTLQKPTSGSVPVSYKISKEFGERYGTWSGELHGSVQLN